MAVLRTARDYHQPPTRWWGGNGTWTDKDLVLTVALTLHEQGLHSCGHPRSWAFSEDSEGYFEEVIATCQACAAAEAARDQHPHKPGQVLLVTNRIAPGERIAPWRPVLDDD